MAGVSALSPAVKSDSMPWELMEEAGLHTGSPTPDLSDMNDDTENLRRPPTTTRVDEVALEQLDAN